VHFERFLRCNELILTVIIVILDIRIIIIIITIVSINVGVGMAVFELICEERGIAVGEGVK